MTLNLRTVEAKAFVPARDFALSKRFYLALGFEIPWSSDDLAYVRHGDSSFLLQDFFPFSARDRFSNALVGRARRRLVATPEVAASRR